MNHEILSTSVGPNNKFWQNIELRPSIGVLWGRKKSRLDNFRHLNLFCDQNSFLWPGSWWFRSVGNWWNLDLGRGDPDAVGRRFIVSSQFHWKSRWVFLGQVIVCSDLSSDRTICNFDYAVIITVIIPFYVCTFHLIIKKKDIIYSILFFNRCRIHRNCAKRLSY